mgnify:CR=1 FL=1
MTGAYHRQEAPVFRAVFAKMDVAGAEATVRASLRRELAALAFDSNSVSMLAELSLSRGRSDVVQVADTARTLVLYQAGQEVMRVPMRPDPAQRNILRP